jgi:hypothetical protein
MEVGVEIDAVPERLNDGDNPRLDGRSGHGLKIKKNRSDGTAAKIPQEPSLWGMDSERPDHIYQIENRLDRRAGDRALRLKNNRIVSRRKGTISEFGSSHGPGEFRFS